MKRFVITLSIIALGLTAGTFAAKASAEPKRNQRATIEFTETVKLLNVVLKGEYLVVHDEALMAKGEACTYVYDSKGKLVVSFHCVPVERPKANSFRVVSTRVDQSGLREIVEIQFAGSTEAHKVR